MHWMIPRGGKAMHKLTNYLIAILGPQVAWDDDDHIKRVSTFPSFVDHALTN